MPLVVLAVVSVAMTAASMAQQKKAADQSKALAKNTADYNAAIDISQARQLDLDTVQNIRNQRANDAVYTSRQATAYASAGVLSSGSPLHVMAETKAKMEQAIQQEYTNSQQKQAYMYSAAQAGIKYGEAQASAIQTQSNAAMLAGGAHLVSSVAGMYQSGMFSSTRSAPSGLNPNAK